MFGSYALAVGRGAHRHALRQRADRLALPVRAETRELLLAAATPALVLADGDAILVGQLFDQSGERLDRIPAILAQLDAAEDPAAALRAHWGNFALFFAAPGRAFAYRDPSGSVPVYRCGSGDPAIFVSDAAIADRLGLLDQPPIDALFLVHWLQFPFLRTRRSGLADVTELLPGMVAEQRRSGAWSEGSAWHPSTFARESLAIGDPKQAARRLREMALTVVAAQPVAGNIVLRLSGGLDSSIIAACLASAGVKFACVNFATDARDGDERRYARAVAGHLRLELAEVGEPEPAGLAVPSVPSFRPQINPLLEPFERSVAGAASRLGASLLIDGAGGDNLFCSVASAAPVLDALAGGHLARGMAAARDVAARAECTLWDVLAAARRRLAKRQRRWKEDLSFLLPHAVLKACEPHPWLEKLQVPPGKREHVEALVHIQHFLDRAPSPAPVLHPLLAQPLLELCLGIPSWLWVRGGRDRAIARDAFSGLVPGAVLERRMKGSLQSLLYRSFARLRDDIWDLLAGGELARRKIIDASAVADALAGEAWMTDMVQLRLSEIVALELWLRSWSSPARHSSSGS